MQQRHHFQSQMAETVGLAVRALVLTGHERDLLLARLGGMCGLVDCETELYSALASLIDDPSGYGLFVINCDELGGPETGARALQMLKAAGLSLPVILISRDYVEQTFPQDRHEPVCLRGPVSLLGLHIGFEHAMRDRLLWNAVA